MAAGIEYLNYILGQLAGLARLASRRMFGGHGLYCDGQFFALIFRDTLYFKVGDATRNDYESRGMSRFRPYADRPYLSMTYYEVPADVLEDGEQLILWARRAVAEALASSQRKTWGRQAASVTAERKTSKTAGRQARQPKGGAPQAVEAALKGAGTLKAAGVLKAARVPKAAGVQKAPGTRKPDGTRKPTETRKPTGTRKGASAR